MQTYIHLLMLLIEKIAEPKALAEVWAILLYHFILSFGRILTKQHDHIVFLIYKNSVEIDGLPNCNYISLGPDQRLRPQSLVWHCTLKLWFFQLKKVTRGGELRAGLSCLLRNI